MKGEFASDAGDGPTPSVWVWAQRDARKFWKNIAYNIICDRFPNTVELPCATSSREQPPPISDRLSKKHHTSSRQNLTAGTSSKQPHPLFGPESFMIYHCF